MLVTRISSYIWRSVLSAVSHNHSRSWNILPTDMEADLYFVSGLYLLSCIQKKSCFGYAHLFQAKCKSGKACNQLGETKRGSQLRERFIS
jgi:hypothetical protein